MMQLGKNKNLLIISAVIIVLVIVNAFFILNPEAVYSINASADNLQNYKLICANVHETISELERQAESVSMESPEYALLPENERKIMATANQSAKEDIAWIAAKENLYYEQMQMANSEQEAYDILHKEAALFYMSDSFVAYLNSAVKEDSLADYNVMDYVILQAEDVKDLIKVTDFLGEDFALPEDVTLDKEKFRQEAMSFMTDFLEFRKTAFKNARDTYRKFIEAEKIIAMDYFLTYY